MVKSWSVVLGIGLIILGIVGVSSGIVAQWMAWIDIGLGVVSLIAGAGTRPAAGAPEKAGWPGLFSAGLFVMWLIQLIGGTAHWLAWWNFGFGCAYALGALGYLGAEKATGRVAPTSSRTTEDQDRFRDVG